MPTPEIGRFHFLFMCCDFYVRYLDQTNFTSAYVSGIKGILKLQGNMLSRLCTRFNIGTITGSPIDTWMITVVRLRIWSPRFMLVCLDVCKDIS